jgi:hypothetical protein
MIQFDIQRERLAASRLDGYLTKPITAETFLSEVQQ